MNTMKAVRIHAYGDLDVLKYEESPCPEEGDNEALIRVSAVGVNPYDWKVRAGYLAGWVDYSFPLILGWDVSGVVAAVGRGVKNLAVGDAVFARADYTRNGAYAEYVAVEASLVEPKPVTLDFIHAAAVPHAALAAWQSLFKYAGLSAGQTVLIHGAAGGVGHFAVQFAKLHGAHVIGTSSEHNLDFLRQLGVDQAIDYTATRFDEVVHDVDVVLDTIGGEVLQRSWKVLKPGGMLVSVVEMPPAETAAAYGVSQTLATADADEGVLAQIAALIDSGQVKPVVSTVLPLTEVGQAHTLSASQHTRGKIVLQVTE
jgi:NADPH:quinone reductase-like Zn-dependent oxidoreductase